jgi:hypothetical protein
MDAKNNWVSSSGIGGVRRPRRGQFVQACGHAFRRGGTIKHPRTAPGDRIALTFPLAA